MTSRAGYGLIRLWRPNPGVQNLEMHMATALLAYRKSCMFLYGMTDRGFDRALGTRLANSKVRSLISMLRGA